MIPTASDPIATLVFFLLVFTVIGAVFLFIHLLMGSFLRPYKPDAEKLTIYECGEPTVGSAWIQFDLRFYVVALLFVIFDVEVAFFFPWATVFGTANQLARIEDPVILTKEEKEKRLADLAAQQKEVEQLEGMAAKEKEKQLVAIQKKRDELEKYQIVGAEEKEKRLGDIQKQRVRLTEQLMPSGLSNEAKVKMKLVREVPAGMGKVSYEVVTIRPETAATWATILFWDIVIFFGVLMVGFAYVWRRGDIDWVRAYAHHHEPAAEVEKPLEQPAHVKKETVAAH